MSISKEERYAMIRRAAIKVQKRNKIGKSREKLIRDMSQIDRQDYKSHISWGDSERFVEAHYGDVYKATTYEEWN